MKWNSFICGAALAAAIMIPAISRAGETNSVASDKPTPYPLDHCVVSGEKFGGDMGKPIEFIYKTNGINQEIKFCCPMCKPEFLKNPDKYMKVIKAAEAKNAKS
jgi:YHS domain-containing protein